jgi:hypothetical protein
MLKLRQLSALIFCSTLFVNCALAQTTLTQIQDTVYNPDGTLFSGTVIITFNGFATPGTIAPQSTSAQIYTGAVSVLLVPSTTASPGAYYQAIYNSRNGLVTWTETWSVPPSSTPMTLSQVRTSTTEGSGGSGGGGGQGGGSGGGGVTLPIRISDVTGLASDLATINSSLSGLTTAENALSITVSSDTSSIATLNTILNGLNTNVTGISNTVSGLTTTVTGVGNTVTTLGNTVTSLSAQVNALSAGSSTAMFADSETPSGTMDGTNANFSLATAPAPAASLQLYRNGLQQLSGTDFTLSGNTITFLNGNIPKLSDIVQAFYRFAGTGQKATFSDAEVPSGTINGTNTIFTLAAAPNPVLSLELYKNGMLLQQNSDYTLSGTTVTFTTAQVTPQPGDSIVAYYRH